MHQNGPRASRVGRHDRRRVPREAEGRAEVAGDEVSVDAATLEGLVRLSLDYRDAVSRDEAAHAHAPIVVRVSIDPKKNDGAVEWLVSACGQHVRGTSFDDVARKLALGILEAAHIGVDEARKRLDFSSATLQLIEQAIRIHVGDYAARANGV